MICQNVCEDQILYNFKYPERTTTIRLIFLNLSYKSFLRYWNRWAIPYFIK